METLDSLMQGFSVALDPMNLVWVTVGVALGTVFGLMPGIGPTAGVALLLPLTFSMEASSAIIMLAGIYYGTMYGGRIPAILIRMPGDASAVITTLDGYPLAKEGKAGSALGITAIGSFIGGTVAIVGLTFLAPPLAKIAKAFGPPELFMLLLFGILMVVFISAGSMLKSFVMTLFGFLIASVGMDPIEGTERLTYGSAELSAGINIIALAIGLFGIGEVLHNLSSRQHQAIKMSKVANVLPTRADWLATRFAILRASIVGFLIGIIPGGGGTVSSVVSYGLQKRLSKNPERFGKGAIDGLAATETADNASSNSAFIPLLTLGLPPNSVLALIFGALLLQNITPGPQLIEEHPDVFFGVIASMYIGNLILLILNLPLIRVFITILRIPMGVLAPIVVVVAIAGVYSASNSIFDVLLIFVFGLLGFALKQMRFDMAPLMLGFILGPLLEVQWRRSMIMSNGSIDIFFTRTSSLLILIVLLLAIVASIFTALRKNRESKTSQAAKVCGK